MKKNHKLPIFTTVLMVFGLMISTVSAQTLVINEFLPDPATDWSGNGSVSSSGDEWVEIYNTTDQPINLNGYYIGDVTDPLRFQFGDETLYGHCWRVVYGDEGSLSLNNSGDTVYLYAPDGTTLVDSYTYASSSDDVSHQRTTDGGTWGTSPSCAAPGGGASCPNPGDSNDDTVTCLAPDTPTPGPTDTPVDTATPVPTATATGTPTPYPFPIRINEILANPATDWDGDLELSTSGDEWIEIYNSSSVPFELTGFWIGDASDPYRYQFGYEWIGGHCWRVVYGSDGYLSLNNTNETITLTGPGGTLADSISYSSSTADASYRRLADGVDIWDTSPVCAAPGGGIDCPNPNASNDGQLTCMGTVTPAPTSTPIPTYTPGPNPLFINEFMADPDSDWSGDGGYDPGGDEWVEIFNASPDPVYLGGLAIGSTTVSKGYIFGDEWLGGFCWRVVYGDDGDLLLGNDGDTVHLLEADTNTIVDMYTYTGAFNDISIRREVDGGPDWVLSAMCEADDIGDYYCPNPGESNNGTFTCLNNAPTSAPTDTPTSGPSPTPEPPTETPTEGPTNTPAPTFTPRIYPIVINEFLASPGTDWDGDTFLDTTDDEWIEIYNTTEQPVNLQGYALGDELNAQRYVFGDEWLGGHCWRVVYGSEAALSLNNGGDTVMLTAPDMMLADSHTYASASTDMSIRRTTDGGLTWGDSPSCAAPGGGTDCPNPNASNHGMVSCIPFDTPTPGPTATYTPTPIPTDTDTPEPTATPAPPTETPTPSIYPIVLNELMPDPNSDWDGDLSYSSSGDEWIEIYNNSDDPINLNGFYLGDVSDPLRFQFGSEWLGPHCWRVVYGSEASLSLNNSSETAYLTAPDGVTLVDSYSWSSSANDISHRRTTDGGPTWSLSLECAAPGGGADCPNPNASNDATGTCQPFDTPTPGDTATPTDTPIPTDTPMPTDTPTPTPEPTVEPTATPEPTCPPCVRAASRNFTIGWNMVGFHQVPVGLTNAGSFANALVADGMTVTHVAKWTASGWAIYQVGLPFNNFLLENQQGYMIRMTAGGTWTYEVDHCQ